jgi:hypothetical protein
LPLWEKGLYSLDLKNTMYEDRDNKRMSKSEYIIPLDKDLLDDDKKRQKKYSDCKNAQYFPRLNLLLADRAVEPKMSLNGVTVMICG